MWALTLDALGMHAVSRNLIEKEKNSVRQQHIGHRVEATNEVDGMKLHCAEIAAGTTVVCNLTDTKKEQNTVTAQQKHCKPFLGHH